MVEKRNNLEKKTSSLEESSVLNSCNDPTADKPFYQRTHRQIKGVLKKRAFLEHKRFVNADLENVRSNYSADDDPNLKGNGHSIEMQKNNGVETVKTPE